MVDVVCVQNKQKQMGITHGLCNNCGYVKTTRNLKQDVLNTHFSNKWLNMRTFDDFKVTHSVYDILKPYIDKKRHKSVLDIGCGNGDKLSAFENHGFETFGVEPSTARTETARKNLLKSDIQTGFSEDYLQETQKKFDIIYIENVMQFTVNPFLLFDLAASKLNDGGLLYLRAQRFDYSSFSMFSLLSLIRSYVSLYSLKPYIKKNGLDILYYTDNPFVLVLSKTNQFNEKTSQILKESSKITFDDIAKTAKNEFSSKLSFLTKSITIRKKSMKRSMRFKIINSTTKSPIEIISDCDELPIILK